MEKVNRVIMGPDAETLDGVVSQAIDAANEGFKARTVGGWMLDADRVMSDWNSGGGEWATGGGVSNSYGQHATTSYIGVAWVDMPNGERHVRITAGRCDAPQSSGGRVGPNPFFLAARTWTALGCAALVYPVLSVRMHTKSHKGIAVEMCRDLVRDPDCLGTWMALADWLADNTPPAYYRGPNADECRSAIRLLEQFQP